MDGNPNEATRTIAISAGDIERFVELVGDRNPIHVDEDYAAGTRFQRRIAPGMLVASYISAVIANQLPGPGVIYLEQNLRFEAPVYIGDAITVRVRVAERPRPDRLRLETTCSNQSGQRVLSGTALVQVSPPVPADIPRTAA